MNDLYHCDFDHIRCYCVSDHLQDADIHGEGAGAYEEQKMTIEQINEVLQHPKAFWSHEVEEAKEGAKEAVRILSEFSEVTDARKFINKIMEVEK